MSYKQDYILRLAEQFAKILAYLLGLLKEEKFVELHQALQQTWIEHLNVANGITDEMDETEIIRLLINNNSSEDHWELASDLLYIEGMSLLNKDKAIAIRKIEQSVFVLNELEKRSLRNFSITRSKKKTERQQFISTLQ